MITIEFREIKNVGLIAITKGNLPKHVNRDEFNKKIEELGRMLTEQCECEQCKQLRQAEQRANLN